MNSSPPGFRVTERHRRRARRDDIADRGPRALPVRVAVGLALLLVVVATCATAPAAAVTADGTASAGPSDGSGSGEGVQVAESAGERWDEAAATGTSTGGAAVAPTIDETVTFSHPSDEPMRIEANLSYEIPTDSVESLEFGFTPLLSNETIVETNGFSTVESTYVDTAVEWNGTDPSPSVTIRYDRRFADSNKWTVTGPHEGWAFANADLRVNTDTVPADVESTIETERVFDPDGTVYGGDALVGNVSSVATTVEEETIRVIVPDAASLDVSRETIRDALAFSASTLDVGERSEEVPVLVVPSDDVEPIGAIGFAEDSNAYGLDNVPLSTWIHEYVHTRQDTYATSDETEWVREGGAEYYGHLHAFEYGQLDYRDFVRQFEWGTEVEDVVLSDSETWRGTEGTSADYTKGSLVVAALDAEIRAATDGAATFADVFEAWNGHGDDDFNQTAFEGAVESAAGSDVADAASTYTKTNATPAIPSAATYALYFDGDVPPDESFGELSGTVVDGTSGDPLEGATVGATVSELGRTFETTTGPDGSYRLDVPGDVQYEVAAEADGYDGSTETVTVAAGESSTVDAALQGDAVVSGHVRLNGTLEKTPSVTARVAGDAPEADATLETETTWEAELDEDGRYELRLPGTGATYAIEAAARGYASNETSVTVAGDVGETNLTIDRAATYFGIEHVDALAEIDAGNESDATVTVANYGRDRGTGDVALRIDGETVATESVALDGTDGETVATESVALDGTVATANVTLAHRHESAGTFDRVVATANESVTDSLTVRGGDAPPGGGGGVGALPPPPAGGPDLVVDAIDVADRTVAVGDRLAVDVVVVNAGDERGSRTLTFEAGTVTERTEVALAPGEIVVVPFAATFEDAGSRTIRVNELTASIDVVPADGAGAVGDPAADGATASAAGAGSGTGGDGSDQPDGTADDVPGFGIGAALAAALSAIAARGARSSRRNPSN